MIAIDATPLVLGPRRGVARALRELLAGLDRVPRPERVRVLAPGPLPSDVPPLDGPLVREVASARAFRRRLPSLLGDARVLVSPWSAYPASSVPTVVWIHELPHVRHGAIEGRLRVLRHLQWLHRDRKAAAVLVPSEATRADVLASGRIDPSRVHLVPNAFDPTPWRTAKPGPDGPDVVMVGTGAGDGRKKGVDVFLDAWPRLADATLRAVVVGRVVGRTRPPGLKVLPDLDDARLRSLVASAGLLVHPARSEGFGYPPLEAMAAGVPTVVASGGSLAEVVGDAALVVPAGDPVRLAEAMRELRGDAALRERLIGRGRARAADFSPEATAARFLEVMGGVA